MTVKEAIFCVFVIVLASFGGSDGAPRPCPQFLPVAVRMESSRTPYHLKTSVKVKDDKESSRTTYQLNTSVKVKDDKENLISEDAEKTLLVLSPSEPTEKPAVSTTENKPTNENSEEKMKEPKLLQISKIPKDNSEIRERPRGQSLKKRRRLRPKESRKIILSQNSNWALKTINDKPAAEVLMTDKASVARDLKDATESALVDVKQLEDLHN